MQEGPIPTRFYEKIIERINTANGGKMNVSYKLPKAHVCQSNACFKTSFILVKDMVDTVILGLPFIYLLYPFTVDENGLTTKPFGQTIVFKFILHISLLSYFLFSFVNIY